MRSILILNLFLRFHSREGWEQDYDYEQEQDRDYDYDYEQE